MLKRFSIILCGTASSTLSWAIFSNRPIIFINYSDRAPLSKKYISYLKIVSFVLIIMKKFSQRYTKIYKLTSK